MPSVSRSALLVTEISSKSVATSRKLKKKNHKNTKTQKANCAKMRSSQSQMKKMAEISDREFRLA